MSVSYFVFDTNTLVSGLLFRQGKPSRAIYLARDLGTIVLSAETEWELIDVFQRKKFDKYVPKEERRELLASLLRWVETVDVVTRTIQISRDPDDNKFLELAVEVDAECIISGDKDLLVLGSVDGIPILNANDFLKRYSR